MGDLINTVKARAAGRLEGARMSFQDLLHTPEFIFEETAHQGDYMRTVLVLDNLEEKDFFTFHQGPFNLCHMRMVVKTVAKFHAVSLTYKQMLFSSFTAQRAQAKASRSIDEVVTDGDKGVLTGRQGLFARFPFLAYKQENTLSHLIANRERFLDMYLKLLECFPEESHLVDIFEYIRMSTDNILRLEEDMTSADFADSPLDAIILGILEARSFLFKYDDDENKENDKAKKNSKLQRSQSERIKDRSQLHRSMSMKAPSTPQPAGKNSLAPPMPNVGAAATAAGVPAGTANGTKMPASAKCPKLDQHHPKGGAAASASASTGTKAENKFLHNVKFKSKDDVKISLMPRKANKSQRERDPNVPPRRAALVNAKYVTYGRITRDLAVVFWTSSSSLIRRFYLIKMIECYVETLGITLGQLGIDTDTFGLKYQDMVIDFQKHLLYGFLISVLQGMAVTSEDELERLHEASARGERLMDIDSGGSTPQPGAAGTDGKEAAATAQQQPASYISLSCDRIEFLLDLMRDIGAYVESKDFEQGLPITNFERYHELWSMEDDAEEEHERNDGEEADEEDEDEEYYSGDEYEEE